VYTVGNGRMTSEKCTEKDLEGNNRGLIKIPSWKFPGGTKE
jgi:hypothetical protein